MHPQLQILICTIDNGIAKVPAVLTPPVPHVSYLVSWQQSETGKAEIGECPQVLAERTDVEVVTMQGKGLSANRNNAIRHATGDILLLSDDDARYAPVFFDRIFRAFQLYPEADILTFQVEDYEGTPLSQYAAQTYDYANRPYGSHVRSLEIAMRRSSRLPNFDERFGLGSPFLACGEEEIFIHTAFVTGLKIRYVPEVIVRTEKQTTGTRFLTSPAIQRSKGAVLCFMHGWFGATLRCIKYAATLPASASRLQIFRNMWQGIRYIQRTRS